MPAKSLPELVALLKSEPDKLTFSSGGFGTPAHLAGELFKLQTGVRAAHVPYRAVVQAITDLLNGTNHYQFVTPLLVVNLIADGKLRALAVTAPTRMAALKDVPTVGEEGFPELIIQDLDRFRCEEWDTSRRGCSTERSRQQSVGETECARCAGEDCGGTRWRFFRRVRGAYQISGRALEQSRERLWGLRCGSDLRITDIGSWSSRILRALCITDSGCVRLRGARRCAGVREFVVGVSLFRRMMDCSVSSDAERSSAAPGANPAAWRAGGCRSAPTNKSRRMGRAGARLVAHRPGWQGLGLRTRG